MCVFSLVAIWSITFIFIAILMWKSYKIKKNNLKIIEAKKGW